MIAPVHTQSLPANEDGRRTRHQHRRTELVSLLAEHFLSAGLADQSLRPIAASIGVSHSTLIRHFKSKDELIFEVVQKITEDYVLRLTGEMKTQQWKSLNDFVTLLWQAMKAPYERQHFEFLFEISASEARRNPPLFDVGRLLTEDLIAPVTEMMQLNFLLSAHDARILTQIIAAQIRGVILHVSLGGNEAEADQMMAQFIDMVEHRYS